MSRWVEGGGVVRPSIEVPPAPASQSRSARSTPGRRAVSPDSIGVEARRPPAPLPPCGVTMDHSCHSMSLGPRGPFGVFLSREAATT